MASKSSKGRKMSNDTNSPSSCKRLVIVVGDKGGVGKTTFSRGLLQLYINSNIPCIAYDADSRNPQLQRYYKGFHKGLVRFVDFFARGAADDLLIDLEKENFPVYLLDLPAQSGGFFESYVKELSFFKILEAELNCKVTMVSVISRVLDSVNLLEYLHNYCQEQVNYVVVKNLFHGAEEKFERYDDSNLRKQMLERGLIETSMPDLFYKPYDFLDRHSLTFSQALKHSESNIVIKARISAWLADFEEKMRPGANLLGLNSPSVSDHYQKMLESLLGEATQEAA